MNSLVHSGSPVLIILLLLLSLFVILLSPSASFAQPPSLKGASPSLWDHNGSVMRMFRWPDGRLMIAYDSPREGIADLTPRGTVMLTGMSDVDTDGAERRRNKRWPEALKREIVVATPLPGASVSTVARQYDVNANQVFGWRRRYRDAVPATAPTTPAGLVPVIITPGPDDEVVAPSAPAASETIEIEIAGDYRVRVGSDFDGRALKRVLDVLRKR